MAIMIHILEIMFVGILCFTKTKCEGQNFTFPKDFLFGVGSSAFQAKRNWNVGASVTATYNHENKDSYGEYKEDITILQDLGVDFYRFSMRWHHILPNGESECSDDRTLNFYHKLLDKLQVKGIKPFVTLYDWEHPKILEDFGGWLNELMIEKFVDYAKIIFTQFGDRVEVFTTINEPAEYCSLTYERSEVIAVNDPVKAKYQCVHNMMKAHARVYHLYKKEFQHKNNGKIGIAIHCGYQYNNDPTDTIATYIAHEFGCGWQANLIFSKKGDYPEIMKQRVAERSKAQGYNESKLPKFSDEEIEYIKGTADYFGLIYFKPLFTSSLNNTAVIDWPNDAGLNSSSDQYWPLKKNRKERKIDTIGFREILKIVKDKYDNPPVYILENGIRERQDDQRLDSLLSHLKQLSLAIKEDNCNVKAYTAWNLMNLFEYRNTPLSIDGLIHANLGSFTLVESTLWYKKFLESRIL